MLRLEDGFLRSVGLGADLIRPLSLVIDNRSMYFDSSRPSDLEVLLQNHDFDDLVCRAQTVREKIVRHGLTKYNTEAPVWQLPGTSRKVILVPGQVETDLSIIYGSSPIRRNMDLLKAVRKANPYAYIVYKKHPDIAAGLRAQGVEDGDALCWCDEVVENVSIHTLLLAVDEVHVMTSLCGFEALLRGKSVTCYGQPFYSGWGLTTDVVPLERRSRKLTLDELVAGALLLYPKYFDYELDRQVSVEDVLERLRLLKESRSCSPSFRTVLARLLLRKVVGVR